MSLAHALAQRGLDWIIPEWPAPPNVHALMTTRNAYDDAGLRRSMNLARVSADAAAHAAADLERNRALLQKVTGVPPVWLSQVHGTAVRVVDDAPAAAASGATESAVTPSTSTSTASMTTSSQAIVSPASVSTAISSTVISSTMIEADGAVITRPGRAATVRVADCLPVLFTTRDGSRVAAAHAGWRGLKDGILESTVSEMNANPGDIIAWLGPAIGPTAFEVGDDVRDEFIRRDPLAARAFMPFPGRPGKHLADLYTLARMRLADAGVRSVHGGHYCTYTDTVRFFSYRRDKSMERMAALIWIVPE